MSSRTMVVPGSCSKNILLIIIVLLQISYATLKKICRNELLKGVKFILNFLPPLSFARASNAASAAMFVASRLASL